MISLVKVTPIEYQRKGKRIVRYFGYKLKDFDAADLQKAIDETNVSRMPEIWEESGYIFYRYPSKPLIVIWNRDFYTLQEVWRRRKFTQKQIRQQASILLRILKAHGLADYKKRKGIPTWRFKPTQYRNRKPVRVHTSNIVKT